MIKLPAKVRDDGTREAQYHRQLWEAIRGLRAIGGEGIKIQETPGGAIISVDTSVLKDSGDKKGVARWG